MFKLIEIADSPTNGSVCIESYGITALLWDNTQWVSNSYFKVIPPVISFLQKDRFVILRKESNHGV